jgi:hypothetical protein
MSRSVDISGAVRSDFFRQGQELAAILVLINYEKNFYTLCMINMYLKWFFQGINAASSSHSGAKNFSKL